MSSEAAESEDDADTIVCPFTFSFPGLPRHSNFRKPGSMHDSSPSPNAEEEAAEEEEDEEEEEEGEDCGDTASIACCEHREEGHDRHRQKPLDAA